MRLLLFLIIFFTFQFSYSQAFYGSGDTKLQIGANLQNKGTGIMGSLDFGLGDNISVGVSSSYLIGVDKITTWDGEKIPFAKFKDRFDLKARVSAHLSDVINVNEAFDIYPGLYSSLKHFGGHIGVRYFFTHGLGVFTELNIPIAKYNSDHLTSSQKLHNQISVNLGLSFNI